MKTPLKRAICPSHPLLILMAPAGQGGHLATRGYTGEARFMVECWHRLPDDIKPHVSIQIEGICDDHFRRNEMLLPIAQAEGVPITVQVQTNNSDLNDTVPMDTVRRYVDTYSCIDGLQIAEASQRTFVSHGGGPEYSMGRNARYARDIIRICGEYGLFMSWQLMSENFAAIGCSADNEALFDTVCEYGEYVIPMHEMNCEFAKYIDHLSAFGLWFSGATANWGVEAQSWYWSDAGLSTPGSFEPGSLDMPGEMYSIMFMLGAVGGATAYSVEPSWDIWPGPGEWRFRDWVVPTFRRLVSERLIPERHNVAKVTPVAYHLPRCERPIQFHAISDDLDFDHGAGRLIRGTFGVYDRARDPELIPNDPRFGWFPVLPAKTDRSVLGQFQRVLRPGDVDSPERARELMGTYYPPIDRGTAWSQIVGDLIFAVNTHENWFVPEEVRLQIPRRPRDVRIESAGTSQLRLRWDKAEGDNAYRVWRTRDGVETCLTENPTTETEFLLAPVEQGDQFAVSAITSATEEFAQTLHLHQFLVFNRAESRRSEWVNAAGDKTERFRFAESVPQGSEYVLEAERRCAGCLPVQDLTSPPVAPDDPFSSVKLAIMDHMAKWKSFVEAEDLDGIMGMYAADYSEPDGRGKDWVEAAFRLVLRRYMESQFARLVKEWGALPGWRNPAFRLLVREWKSVTNDTAEVLVVAHMWAGGGPEMEPSDMFNHPFGRPHTTVMRWRRTNQGWKIAGTDPAFLRIEDTAIFRFRYQGW
ncbi:MAG: Glycosyl hydrolase family 98 [Candidatus Latescibacteria bacterium ADurb.Bin168]|nr:MAG: Glycosyl hydrolase family 98 [Candidatus Latescibacteria bacterium ADurb.Bin168]